MSFTPGVSFTNDVVNVRTAGHYGIWAGNMMTGMLDIGTAETGTKIKGVLKAGGLVARLGIAKYTARNFRSNLINWCGTRRETGTSCFISTI